MGTCEASGDGSNATVQFLVCSRCKETFPETLPPLSTTDVITPLTCMTTEDTTQHSFQGFNGCMDLFKGSDKHIQKYPFSTFF